MELTTTGRERPVPPGEDLTAYRIIQEALTNVTRHSGAAAAGVHLDYGEDQLMMDVTDEGPVSDRAPGPVGLPRHGHGLAGMRERAQLYGGDLRAAPTARGGFQVTVHLPLTAPPTPAGPAGRGPRAAR